MTYSKININPAGSGKTPELYQKFYPTTPKGVNELAEILRNNPEQVIACKKRLSELDSLLKLDENRCHVSRDQRNFLRRMLVDY